LGHDHPAFSGSFWAVFAESAEYVTFVSVVALVAWSEDHG